MPSAFRVSRSSSDSGRPARRPSSRARDRLGQLGHPRREQRPVQRDGLRGRVGGDAGDVLLDRGQREAVRLQLADQLEPGDVVRRVVARPAAADRRRHQALGRVEPDVAHADIPTRRVRLSRVISSAVSSDCSGIRSSGLDRGRVREIVDHIGRCWLTTLTVGVSQSSRSPVTDQLGQPSMAEQPQAFVYDAIRTPRGKGKKNGSLHEVKPVDLVVGLLDEVKARNPGLDPARVDDVVLGVVTPIGDQGGDIAKTAALAAGYPETVAGVQLNRFCASGPRGGQPGRDAGPLRLRGPDPRRRRGVDVAGADGLRRRRLGDGPAHRARHLVRAAGHRRRPDRHARGLEPRGRRRVRRRVAGPRRQGAGQRLLRRLGDPGQGLQRR